MANNDLISIIVPIYNSEKYLHKCLNSLQKQTYTNIEIIMIDDGSTDNSADICKSFSATDDRFVYIYQKNSGVSSARNNGIGLAKGEYIGFCDSDDYVENDMYEMLFSLLRDTGSDISICGYVREDNNGVVEGNPKNDESIQIFDAENAIIEMHKGDLFAGHLCNKLIKKELFSGVKLQEDVAIYEDMLFMWSLFCNAKKVAFQQLYKYHYVMSPNSAMRAEFKESFWSVQIACREMEKYMKMYYPKNLRYAQMTTVVANYSIAIRLVSSSKLNRSNYFRVKKEIKCSYNKEVRKLTGKMFSLKIFLFLCNRQLFSFFKKYS